MTSINIAVKVSCYREPSSHVTARYNAVIEVLFIHPSEWSWVRENLDQLINNDGTIHDLEQKVKSLL